MTMYKEVAIDTQEQALAVESPHPDYIKFIRCLKIFGAFLIPAAILYLLTGDKQVVLYFVGAVFLLLALYHTPFGLMVLFSFLSLEHAVVFREDFSASKLLGIVVLASYLLHMLKLKFFLGLPQRLMILFCLWSWASYLWCIDPVFTMSQLQQLSLQIGVGFIFFNVIRDKKSFFLVLSGFAVGAVIISWMLMFGSVAYSSWSTEELGRALLVEGHSNPVNIGRAISVGFLVLCLTFFWKRRRVLQYSTYAALILMLLAMLLKTQSRLAVFVSVAAPIFAFIMIGEQQYRIKRLLYAAMIAVVAFGFLNIVLKSDLMTESARERFTQTGFKESGRIDMWIDGVGLMMKRPLHGYGLGNAPFARKGKGKGGSLHNNFIAIGADLGLVGLALFGSLLIVLYKQVSRITDQKFKWLGMAMFFLVVVSGVPAVNYTLKDFWYAMQIVVVVIKLSEDYKTVESG